MSSLRSLSRPHSTPSPIRETAVRYELSTQIKEAVRSTTDGFLNENNARACRFLPKSDLENILNPRALQQLFRELLGEDAGAGPTLIGTNPNNVHSTNIDDDIDICVSTTIGTGATSRRAVLALFLYSMRNGLLSLFKSWSLSDRTDFPSDAQMPFSETDLDQWQIPFQYHDHILEYQTIFSPVTIRKLQRHTFTSNDRLPYVGVKTPIKSGSSGTVYSAKIAPKHWEIETSDGGFISENPDNFMVVAVKTFEEIGNMRTREDATSDFEIERQLLNDLRECNISHRMLMLDWGSITIVDEMHLPESHSLIFELATFSLDDFLEDRRCFETYTTKSLLLTRLVDVIEALACLHDNLETLHLDIKPENILVFEKHPSGSEKEDREELDQEQQQEQKAELIWKLSDFGLARKREARQRTDYRVHSSYHSSQPSTLPATRPTGIYQAPEIQERNSSLAGQGSDVWSIGCVALMVLAFINRGPEAVSELTHRLKVSFLNAEGTEKLFYVRSDSRAWNQRDNHYYEYLTDFQPDIGDIPGPEPRFAAAVHPYVIDWSNDLYHSYESRQEQPIIQEALDILFRHVLLINRRDRMKASELHKRLNRIRDRWKSEVEATEDKTDLEEESPPPPNETPANNDGKAPELSKSNRNSQRGYQVPAPAINSPHKIDGDPNAPPDSNEHCHPVLCTAIKFDQADTVRELTSDPEQVRRPCPEPNCQIQPINMALRNDAFQALEVLLKNADSGVTDIRCPSCDRTPIEEACVGSGNREALNCFLRHYKKFNITKDIYKDCKQDLGNESRNLLEELHRITNPQPSSLLGKIARKSSLIPSMGSAEHRERVV
jgi:serine/threonine protein kinase